MEDDDVEGKVTDSWTSSAEEKPSIVEETLKRTSKVLSETSPSSILDYNDVGIEENKEDRCSSSDDSLGKNSSDDPSSKIVFKGFKKRILAQAQENRITGRLNSHESFHATGKLSREKRVTIEGKRGKIAEYAQYLGLQPAPSNKSKCSKCQPTTNSCSANSMLKNQQQCTCPPGSSPQSPGTSDAPPSTASPTTANNFRITRKVYLCAACGTYFENWNLFLHMREIHKRHICLFCLGMFGQAERLSYHLTKKHSVPETSFTSVEDFYNVFKGSCYLICCTCEKVFSETDNFYNHFCSPVQKTRNNAAEVCSICRQTGTHASTCSLALVEAHSGLPGIPGVPVKTSDSSRGSNKRLLKNNRLKRAEETLLTSYHQKLSDMYARKMSKSRESSRETGPSCDEEEAAVSTGGSLETATTTTTEIDTVSETIMEVSKFMEDSRRNKQLEEPIEEISQANNSPAKIESSPCPSASPSRSPSPLRQPTEISLYDSVAETIMEVSRCDNESGANTSADEEDEEEVEEDGSRDAGSDGDVLIMDEVADPDNATQTTNGKEDYDDRLKNPSTQNREEAAEAEEPDDETIDLSDSDDSSRTSRSPKSRDNRASESCSSPEKESHTTSVSFTTVNSTDRSLVIKICTNRNSQFSVTSANGGSLSNDNQDAGRESEENNNGEDSASEGKLSNNGSLNSFRGNEDEDEEEPSDAESVKLESNESNRQTAKIEENEEESTKNGTKKEDEKIDVEETETSNKLENNSELEVVKETPEVESKIEKDIEVEEKTEQTDGIIIAAEDVPSIDLNVEGTLESMKIEDLLKRCISAASGYCVYCNHARRIAVNGKQLGLHVLAEHRFQPQHPAIIIHRDQFVARLKKSLEEVEHFFFNLDSFDSTKGTYDVPDPRTFECFHCRYHSLVHKDIYLHNRKMHQKTILICIMCKSTFYSYSELLCHLCPGVYSPNINVTYRCCLCPVSDLPSAFRLMVHLRKRHHSCDVCLESTGNQQRLSNHVWKHKLHHLCYRCGIAYRNKPDITKHLFWKHGTESVLCKKCLQKKWPHVYHFCIPPTAFVCEECTSSFSRAVALKVHKRLHSGDRPYGCEECPERFISKKLLAKHEASHREPEVVPEIIAKESEILAAREEEKISPEKEVPVVAAAPTEQENLVVESEPKEIVKEVKKVVDVYDLPPLNLSSDSDTDVEDQPQTAENTAKDQTNSETKNDDKNEEISTIAETEPEEEEEEKKEEAQIMDGIWDNFKSYAASLEKQDSVVEMLIDEKKDEAVNLEFLCRVILADHDYCVVSEKTEELKEDTAKIEDNCGTMEGEHDYGYKQNKSPSATSVVLNCDSDTNANGKKKKDKTPKKKKSGSGSSSDSSSDSDSSSCSCGTNCSCSSSSSGSSSSSSSSSDSDSSASGGSPKKQSVRKERKKDKDKEKEQKELEAKNEATKSEIIEEKVETAQVAVEEEAQNLEEANNQSVEVCDPPRSPQVIFRESDLDTDETETDEDFYDEHPQQLANKLLAEKRNQLMLLAAVAPAATESAAVPATPNNLNNGNLETVNTNSVEAAPTRVDEVVHNSGRQGRKRVKTKKRKKSDRAKTSRVATPTVESIKLNIPKSFYQKKHSGFGSSQPALITVLPSRSSTPNLQNSQPEVGQFTGEVNKTLRISIGGSGSENENKRSSKRKRVPKRFYGDSSDEEAERQQQQQQQQQQHYNQPSMKWRKVEPPFVPSISVPAQPQIQANSSANYATKNVTLRLSGFDQPLERIVPMATVASATESEEAAETSSDSSEAEEPVVEIPQPQPQPQQSQQPAITHPIGPAVANALPTNSTGVPGERSANLYCYCQCPYDEVSEMIACDGDDCRIEWFHFECVGIMVPPKGKWYCPDCRKKDESLPGNEEYFD